MITPKAQWEKPTASLYFETRHQGVKLVVFETLMGTYTYSIFKHGNIKVVGNKPTLAEAQQEAEARAGEFSATLILGHSRDRA